MKFKNMIKYLMSALLVVALFACTEDFESINDNTKSAKEVHPKYLLPTAQSIAMNHYFNCDVNDIVTGVLCQHFSQPSYADESNYNFRDGMLDRNIGEFYMALANLKEIRSYVDDSDDAVFSQEEKQGWNLIVTTLETFCFQNITDVNGPAIYSKGFDLVGDPTPSYDSQQDIYVDLMEKLSASITGVTNLDVDMKLGDQDIVFHGDISMWRKFANSMLLRLAMRVSDVDETLSRRYFAMAVDPANGGVITSNDENALFTYHDSPSANSFFENVLDGWTPGVVASNTMYDIMASTADPRISMFFGGPWYYEGLPYGETGTWWKFANINYDLIAFKNYKNNGYWYGGGPEDLPGIFIDFAEVEFFLAEAAVRGYADAGDAKTHYNNAIAASIQYYADFLEMEDVQDDIDAYLASDVVDLDQATSPEAKIERIGREKWVALFLQGGEAWAEARRLDTPQFNVPPGKTVADIPMRLKFSSREWVINDANVQAAAALLNGGEDSYTARLWWDIK
ncbi:MAG: SusD/RagB family nutrient-binding outer membrane lipoprotein [Bacteroidales bacterium]|nr:SusD/RagB family nutrient-binding outer membrane lipoprotein [Bacteroidales bacterium]